MLRIAQAQRELKRYDEALVTLEQARTANAPEAMTDFERARNLALLGRDAEAAGGERGRAAKESAPVELVRWVTMACVFVVGQVGHEFPRECG